MSANPPDPSVADRHDALGRIVGSRSFAGSPRHRAFLERVVRHALTAPHEPALKESVLGVEVFGRDPSTFDPRLDPVVRVEARRLRERLAQYYATEGQHDATTIDLPRGGYAPIFGTRTVTEEPPPAPARAAGAPSSGSPSASRVVWWQARAVAAAVLLIVAIAAGTWWTRRSGPARAATTSLTIAVLPLANLSGDPNLEPRVDGITDEINSGLARVSTARITARTSAFSLKGKAQDVREIGRLLDVNYVVDGSVRQSGTGLRVNLQVNRTSDGFILWSHSADTTAAGLFEIGPQLARAVEVAVSPLAGGRPDAGVPARTRNAQAWDAYVRGEFAMQAMSSAGFQRAAALAQESIAHDPQFAASHTLAASARLYLGFMHDGPFAADELDAIRTHLQTARRLAPRAAAVRANLAAIAALCDLDWTKAEALYEEAVRLGPNDAIALSGAAGAHLLRGRFDEADGLYRRALEVDPLNTNLRVLHAIAPFYAGDAAGAVQRLRQLDTNNPVVTYGLIVSLLVDGQADEARALFTRLQAMAVGWERLQVIPALLDAASGDRRQARARLATLGDAYGTRHPYLYASAYAYSGEPDTALRWLRVAVDRHDPYAAHLLTDPLLDPIRSEPRFRQFWDALPAWTTGVPSPGPYYTST